MEAEIISSNDVLTQILLRLPAKSLVRFKCISKRWLSVISDPKFRHLHHASLHPPPTALFLFRRASAKYTYLQLISLSVQDDQHETNLITDYLSNFHFNGAEIWNIHSCKGLMCIHIYRNPNDENQFIGINNEIYAYNPWTFQHRLFPKLNTKETSYNIMGVHIVFEPLSCHYKIVCVWERLENNEVLSLVERGVVMFSIYSSKIGAWSNSRAILAIKKDDIEFRQGVVWNGNVHWFGENTDIVCLDVENERFRSMPRPEHFRRMKFWYFGESGGHLHLVGKYVLPEDVSLYVLELEDDYAKWNVKHRIDVSSLHQTTLFGQPQVGYATDRQRRYCLLGFNVLCFVVNCRDETEKLVISVNDKIISYDIRDMGIEKLVELTPLKASFVREDIFEFKWFDAYQFIKTNASL